MDLFYYKGGPFLPSDDFINVLSQKVCEHALFQEVCANLLFLICGVVSKKFRKFDYGKITNIEKYGSETPPLYNLTKITSKHIALLHSDNDWLADPQDVEFLRSQIKDNLILDYKVPVKQWNHLDFVWALQAGEYVNSVVFQVLKKY
ncbi:lipase 3-like protein [Leptotrombidium deliense]|uniref:Lipase 3-like protein n=1 Tax=Leptotrombidium deliense TaxID=299467 RepID=A0A443SBH2_9ACAR|nr:lipase 3-like protein [Leptotrombidium deliense]